MQNKMFFVTIKIEVDSLIPFIQEFNFLLIIQIYLTLTDQSLIINDPTFKLSN